VPQQTPSNKRRQPRFVVEGLHGKMTFAAEVEILNMSLSGCAMKLDHRLNIGAEYTLKLEVQDKAMPVKGLVVWAVLDERKKGPRGEDVLVYSAGMKFSDVLTQRLIELLAFIDEHKLIEEKRLGGLRFYIDAPGKALLDVPQPYRVKVISLRGMLMEAGYELAIESHCPMEMSLPEGPPIRFVGRVADCNRVAESGEVTHQIGIEFIEMASPDLKRLDAFVKRLVR
jgi:hypothetical protein